MVVDTIISDNVLPVSGAKVWRSQASHWFRALQEKICSTFEKLEQDCQCSSDKSPGSFEKRTWQRNPDNGYQDGGGGRMALMRGRVFEKVGVNTSTVWGKFAPEFAQQIPGTTPEHADFWASGISLVAHPASPQVPAVHMNTRYIATCSKSWVGGGADITPMIKSDNQDIYAKQFHCAMQAVCDRFDPAYYQKFSQWCDEYFYLPHRQETRGAGGIFYDYLPVENEIDWNGHFAFTKSVGEQFLSTYARIVTASMELPFTIQQRQEQLAKRGRYVEFNLLYDRGTLFGLKTGGNIEAILMSLPPEVRW